MKFFSAPNPKSAELLGRLDKITFKLRFRRTLIEALEETAPLICEAFGANSLAVWFLQEDNEHLRLSFAHNLPEELVRYFESPANYPSRGRGIVGMAMEQEEPVVARNILQREDVPGEWKVLLHQESFKIQTLISYPLFAEDGRLVGILNLYFFSDRKFRDEALSVLKIIANSIGAVIEAQDTYAYLEENRTTLKFERDQLAKLYRAVQTIGIQKEADLQQVVTNLAETVGNAIGAKGIAVWKASEEQTSLVVFAHSGISERYAQYFDAHPYPIRAEETAILVRAFLEKDLKFTKNLWEEEGGAKTIPPDVREMLHRENVFSVASAPLICEGNTFGVLTFYFTKPHTYESSEQYILTLAANVVAFVIGNIQYRQELTLAQREIERALRVSEEARRVAEQEQIKTQSIIENFSDGLIVLNSENTVVIVNREAEVLLDVSADTILNKSIQDFKGMKALSGVLGTFGGLRKKVFRKEIALPGEKTGEITTIFLGPKEKRIGSIIVLHDITREKRIERLKSEFVSLAAHQLRTPLSEIKWALQMSLDGDFGKLEKRQENLLATTYQSNERMIVLVNDLLNVSRLEGGKDIFKSSPTQMRDLVRQEWKSYRGKAREKRVSFLFKEPSKPIPKIFVDEEKIRLVLQNLIDNAIRYTPPKGVVEISLTSSGKDVTLEVRDTGIGIPEHEQTKIFQKFSRASNALKLDTTGSGLGLFISKNIVEAHHGKIWFDSRKNGGTSFYVVLPRF